jgi:hypothetical protein
MTYMYAQIGKAVDLLQGFSANEPATSEAVNCEMLPL